jgi:regulator of replication initiation timing
LGIIDSVGSALSVLKEIQQISQQAATAELKLLVASLTEQLANIKLEAVALREELAESKAENERLRKPPELTFRDRAYYKGEDGPFCPTCYEQDHKAVRMQAMGKAFVKFGKWRCNVCATKIF